MRTVALLACLAAGSAAAQAEPLGGSAAAIDAWLVGDPPREELREAAAQAILDDGRAGLEGLAGRLRAAESADPGGAKGAALAALQSLAVRVALAFLDRAEQSRMVFAGQYDDLRALQPWAGRLCLNLLLATPEWYPVDRRARLVPALRDLFGQPLEAESLARMREIVADELEPEDLRRQLAFALWQWSEREAAEAYLAGVRQKLGSDAADERLSAQRELAQAHYELRAYPIAAAHHRAFLRSAEHEEFRLIPLDYYNAACCASLSGDEKGALDELERCLRLMTSASTDPSLRVDRSLFDGDPELATVRQTPRFHALYRAAFTAPDDPQQTTR